MTKLFPKLLLMCACALMSMSAVSASDGAAGPLGWDPLEERTAILKAVAALYAPENAEMPSGASKDEVVGGRRISFATRTRGEGHEELKLVFDCGWSSPVSVGDYSDILRRASVFYANQQTAVMTVSLEGRDSHAPFVRVHIPNPDNATLVSPADTFPADERRELPGGEYEDIAFYAQRNVGGNLVTSFVARSGKWLNPTDMGWTALLGSLEETPEEGTGSGPSAHDGFVERRVDCGLRKVHVGGEVRDCVDLTLHVRHLMGFEEGAEEESSVPPAPTPASTPTPEEGAEESGLSGRVYYPEDSSLDFYTESQDEWHNLRTIYLKEGKDWPEELTHGELVIALLHGKEMCPGFVLTGVRRGAEEVDGKTLHYITLLSDK